MRCIMCNKGILREKTIDYSEYGISLGKFRGRTCEICGEVFFDSDTAKKIQTKSKELGLFGLQKRTKVAKVGNSLAIRIPKEIAAFVHLKKENEVRIVPKSPKEFTVEIE